MDKSSYIRGVYRARSFVESLDPDNFKDINKYRKYIVKSLEKMTPENEGTIR